MEKAFAGQYGFVFQKVVTFAGMKKAIFILLLSVLFLHTQAQPPDSGYLIREQYISQYKELAVREMQLFGIPASIKLAQAVLESGAGRGDLATKANNHFGIKCKNEWQGDKYFKDDDAPRECFRKYRDAESSFRDHSLFLTTRDRYKFLFNLPVTDYKAWALGLKEAGYATNPLYAERLIKIIEDHQLFLIDQGVEWPPRQPKIAEKPIATNITTDTLQATAAPFHPEVESVTPQGRQIFRNNGVKYIITRPGDNATELAREFDLYTWQIYEFNDMTRDEEIRPGQIIYLGKKKRKAEEDFYVVKPGETMHAISQKFGIRLQRLYDLNRMKFGTQPSSGDTLWMWKKKPSDFEKKDGFLLFRIFKGSND